MLGKMKTIFILAVCTAVAADIEYYTTGNDYLDVEAVIANVTELQAYVDCFKDTKPCTELAASYKKHFAEAIVQACKRCNPPQKHLMRRFLEGVKEVLPKKYNYFRQTIDPENKYFDVLETELSKY